MPGYSLDESDGDTCLEWAPRPLATDLCREDAHEVATRCYVRIGARTQALRQYRLCPCTVESVRAAVARSARIRLEPANDWQPHTPAFSTTRVSLLDRVKKVLATTIADVVIP